MVLEIVVSDTVELWVLRKYETRLYVQLYGEGILNSKVKVCILMDLSTGRLFVCFREFMNSIRIKSHEHKKNSPCMLTFVIEIFSPYF